ncbi:MAG TPA: hypothetical protein VHY22_05515, partial [Chthoniobacteraceae bacterium]|nr:hypothetical protein [Chthoniobacteraceae bacterium]
QTICDDFASRRPLPGVDYGKFPPGAEFPWSYRTVLRKKPGKAMRALGNLGIAAHKAQAAYVSMDYSRLRKCELYTLDDVRLDILAIDEATAKPVEIVVYVLMEAASRLIVAYILKPAAAIRASDVDELLAAGLQTPGFGIGADYVTHILFERGSTACSEGAQRVLETVLGELVINGAPLPRIRVHRTGMNGGVRWIGAPRDKASGNAAGKGVIESFHRRLHSALLHLPGQRGNNRDNQPASLGMESSESFTAGGLAAEAQKLAQFQIAADAVGSRCALRLGMLYVRQLADCVRDAIKAHNGEAGHAYRGHGSHHEAEIAPGVWQRTESTPEPIPMPARNIHFESAPEDDAPSPKGAPQNSPGQRPGSSPREGASPVGAPHQYHLNTPAPSGFVKLTNAQKNAIYFGAWNKVQLANPRLDRFAITRRTLGAVPKPLEMTAGQFEKMLAVFNAIVRDAKSADPF